MMRIGRPYGVATQLLKTEFSSGRRLYLGGRWQQFSPMRDRRFFTSTRAQNDQIRVCIVGAGPAGFYSAKYLLRDPDIGNRVVIDMLDASPTPHGLIRFGVAPDHPEVKNVSNDFAAIAESKHYHFFGNVHVGTDVSVDQLREKYSAVVFAHGSEQPRGLQIPGEELEDVRSAAEFVAWYNGDLRPPLLRSGKLSNEYIGEQLLEYDEHTDPRQQDLGFDLRECKSVAVIGQGNVALDCARILASRYDRLKFTDIPQPVLRELRNAPVETVYVIGRRGPLQMACTIAELRELSKMDGVKVRIPPHYIDQIPENLLEVARSLRPYKRKLKLIEDIAGKSSEDPGPEDRVIEFRFFSAPVQVVPDPEDPSKVKSLVVEKMKLQVLQDPNAPLSGDPDLTTFGVEATGEREEIPVDLVLSSIGYRSIPIPGLPYDERRGTLPSAEGRVIESLDPEALTVLGVYVSGWAKRGSTGIVGTNIGDAKQTVNSIIEDVKNNKLKAFELSEHPWQDPLRHWLPRHLKDIGHAGPVDQDGWRRIDAFEMERGSKWQKPREKFLSVAQMLNVAHGKIDKK